jgi:hypothetical protein
MVGTASVGVCSEKATKKTNPGRRLVDAYQIADTESALDWDKAFSVRGDLLRPGFGEWDSCDPVAHAILDVVEAQNELADAISNFAEGPGSEAAAELYRSPRVVQSVAAAIECRIARISVNTTEADRADRLRPWKCANLHRRLPRIAD